MSTGESHKRKIADSPDLYIQRSFVYTSTYVTSERELNQLLHHLGFSWKFKSKTWWWFHERKQRKTANEIC